MNILAIDTTTNNLLIAVKKGDRIYKNQPQKTSKHLEVALPQVDFVINEAGIELSDLDYIAVNVGPGSFTGIRIGIATAKGILCVNKDIKVVPVNSLEFLAYNVKVQKQKQDFMVVIPSTLEKFYSLTYKNGELIDSRIITRKELEEVKEIIDKAIYCEEHSGLRKFMGILTANRYTDDEKIVLREKDCE